MAPSDSEVGKARLRWFGISGPRKRRVVRVLLVSGTLLAAIFGLLSFEIWKLTSAAAGTHAPAPTGSRKALLVLDVQEDYTGTQATAPFPYSGSANLIHQLNSLSARAAAAGMEVVYLRQVYSRPLSKLVTHLFLGGRGLAGSAGAQLDRRLHLVSNDVFDKPLADAFSSAGLEAFLARQRVGELLIAGLDGAGCVDRSARTGSERGFAVTIVADAIVSRSAAEWDAKRSDYPALGIRLESASEVFARTTTTK